MPDKFFDVPVGSRRNAVRGGLGQVRAMRHLQDDIYTSEVVLVHAYNFAQQTVDVVLKSDPDVPVIRNVPIASGGQMRHIRTFKTISNGDPQPTVGVILYPRRDARLALNDFQRLRPLSNRKHGNLSPIYIADVPVVAELPFENHFVNAGLDNIGPDDTGFHHRSGSFILFKGNGDVVIKAKGNIYAGGTNQTASNMPGAARKGDEGDGLGGAIAGGSGRVYLG